jgi:hypothetical protein
VPGSAHPQPLMLPAFPTHAPCHVRPIGPVLKIVSTGSHQSAIERCRPFRIGPGEPHTWLEAGLDDTAPAGRVRLRRLHPGAAAGSPRVAVPAPLLVCWPVQCRCGLVDMCSSCSHRCIVLCCREQPGICVRLGPHHGRPGAAAASRTAQAAIRVESIHSPPGATHCMLRLPDERT